MSVPLSIFPPTKDNSALRQILLGPEDSDGFSAEKHNLIAGDSFIIWPSERVVKPSDHQEVTLWQTVEPTTMHRLPVTPETVSSAPTEFIQFSELSPARPVRSDRRRVLRITLLGVMLLSLFVMASLVIPDVYYRLRPESASEVAVTRVAQLEPVIQPSETPILPPVDPSLPSGEHLRIPTIGVDASVSATIDPDEALRKGAWRVPDFGRPTDFSQPTIIASHRYGWLWWWQSDFGRKNSFYSLPETKPGDQIEIISDQRRFVYEIYAKTEGQSITDYSADLILYTCKFLNSPERYFVYAKRIPTIETPTANETQSGGPAVFDKS